MQTHLLNEFLQTPQGQTADSILRSCVHCGFCTATCPTYQLLGDELDGPRGRIYLIKQLLEGQTATKKTRQHLDRCLSCRSCETTCPSGVRYVQLLDIGREQLERMVPRGPVESIQRYMLRKVIAFPKRFLLLLKLAQSFKPLLPAPLKKKIPTLHRAHPWPEAEHQRKMLVLTGCAQQAVSPQTSSAAARVLHRLGIQLIEAPEAGCCGALSHHLSASEEARIFIRRNIDAWWPWIEQGAEAIISTASGCGVMIRDYAQLMAEDPAYAEKARRISELTRDISEVITGEDITPFIRPRPIDIAFHSPCTLQHGQKLAGVVEDILKGCGFRLCPVKDPHLCCGSAGSYSILQADISSRLLEKKLRNLTLGQPMLIATANIGCQMHLATGSDIPVIHWIELIDQCLKPGSEQTL